MRGILPLDKGCNMFKKSSIIGLFLSLFLFILFTFQLDKSLIYHSDFARDLYEILKISQGNHTLLGPKLSFGGLYTASYYYYLFAPVFLLSGFNIISVFYFNALLFILAVYYFFINVSRKYPLWKTLVSSMSISLTPIFLFSARNPSISNTHLAFLLMFLTFIHFNPIERPVIILILGFLFGVIINFGFLNLLLFIPVCILIFYKLKKKTSFFYFLLGVIASFLPLLLFEIKNNFIMFRNTFLDKSYLSWVGNKNILHSATGKKNIIENFFFMSSQIKPLILINPAIGLAVLGLVHFFKKKLDDKLLFIFNGFLALFILSILIRFQFALHYLYPTAFFLFFIIIILLLESRYKIFILLMFLLEILFFPKHIYSKSTIISEPFDKAVRYSIENHLVEKNSRFNLVMIAHPSAILGFEYRYFFQKYGFIPLSEFNYAKSDVLLIFTQKKNLNPSLLNSWEIEQFGKKYMDKTQKYTIGDTQIYKAQKN